MNTVSSEVEQLYDFEYPIIYKQLAEDGMLYFGEYGQNWREEFFLT